MSDNHQEMTEADFPSLRRHWARIKLAVESAALLKLERLRSIETERPLFHQKRILQILEEIAVKEYEVEECKRQLEQGQTPDPIAIEARLQQAETQIGYMQSFKTVKENQLQFCEERITELDKEIAVREEKAADYRMILDSTIHQLKDRKRDGDDLE
ncbi:hypothetical protein LQW54_007002 [Pestalotiopsis sp. IQ-011]